MDRQEMEQDTLINVHVAPHGLGLGLATSLYITPVTQY